MAGHGAEIRPLTSCPVTTARWLRCLVHLLHRPLPFRLVISSYEDDATLPDIHWNAFVASFTE
jgi:hypothetical protein